jgi:hypothetical protein
MTLSNSEWAAWVQAVGSVLAILIAVAVPYWQRRTARDDEKEQNEKRASALLLVLWPEIEALKGELTEGRGELRMRQVTNRTELHNALTQTKLSPTPNLRQHIHDGVYFDAPTCRAYHRLVFAITQYEDEFRRCRATAEKNRFTQPREFAEVTERLAATLDYVELVLNESHNVFLRMHAASHPTMDQLLKRAEPIT